MFFTKMIIENFKSIASAEIDFAPFTILVGANASGKSNLINAFKFLSNIATEGIENAVALQGGIPYLTNMSLPKGSPIEISFSLDISNEGWIRYTENKSFALEVQKIDYHFMIQPNLKGGGYHIVEDELILTFDCLHVDPSAKGKDRYTPLNAKYTFVAEKKTAKSNIQLRNTFDPLDVIDEETRKSISENITHQVFARICNEDKNELMLYRVSMLLPPVFSESTFIRIFDFDPKELKKASSMASTKILEENGSNLASVLHNILRTKENRDKLTTYLKSFLPFVNGISVENNLDRSFSYKIQENFSNRAFHSNFLCKLSL